MIIKPASLRSDSRPDTQERLFGMPRNPRPACAGIAIRNHRNKQENNKRLRYLSQEEIVRLLDACSTKVVEFPRKRGYIYQGNPISGIKTAFAAALKRSGIEDFRFHDLRHTFARHLIMRGGSLKDAQELLGHKTMTMTLRYAHLSQEPKKAAVNLLSGLTSLGYGHKQEKIS